MGEGRRLFCELSPLAYRISVEKGRLVRKLSDALSGVRFAKTRSEALLPVLIYTHKSLIRRRLGDVDPRLQENKAVNLSLAAPKIDHILIKPGETFSFWRLAGRSDAKKGYKEGLVVSGGKLGSGIGGGMCQFTNLLHWMILHTPMAIVERHHHDGLDLFPDFGRQLPFGCGTSVFYNYLDYRFFNATDRTYQLIVSVSGEYLCGELRADRRQEHTYHIETEEERFTREGGVVYRRNTILRKTVDPKSGMVVKREILQKNRARVLYDTSNLSVAEIDKT